jgi:hypothetical protein
VSKSVADLVNEAMARKRRPDGRPWGPYQLMGAIGLLEGDRPFNITQVQRLLSGERRSFSADLIERLTEILDIDRYELWEAALESSGMRPPGVTAEVLRELDLTRAGADKVLPGYHGVALPGLLDLDPDLIRRTRVERRRRDRRRRRPWIVPIELEKVAA